MWDDVDVTTDLQSLLCNDFQWAAMVVVEQGQRWRCPTFTPRSTILAPYASTEVVSSLDSSVPDAERDVLAFFRCACSLRWDAAAQGVALGRPGLCRSAPCAELVGSAGAAVTRRQTSWASCSGRSLSST